MDIFTLIAELILLAGAAVGFIYGAAKFFKPRKALLLQLITCASGCLLLGQLFTTLQMVLQGGYLPYGFNVGILGTVGCYFFLYSGSFGQIDGLGDNHHKSNQKYRLIAFAYPIAMLVAYLFVLFSGEILELKVAHGVLFLLFGGAGYFGLKHLIMPDVKNGILESIRPYNALLLTLTALNAAETILKAYNLIVIPNILMILCAPIYAVLVCVLGKGVKKWYL